VSRDKEHTLVGRMGAESSGGREGRQNQRMQRQTAKAINVLRTLGEDGGQGGDTRRGGQEEFATLLSKKKRGKQRINLRGKAVYTEIKCVGELRKKTTTQKKRGRQREKNKKRTNEAHQKEWHLQWVSS